MSDEMRVDGTVGQIISGTLPTWVAPVGIAVVLAGVAFAITQSAPGPERVMIGNVPATVERKSIGNWEVTVNLKSSGRPFTIGRGTSRASAIQAAHHFTKWWDVAAVENPHTDRPKPEVMAIRHTYDGKEVQFWTDGAITHGRIGEYIARNVSPKIIWLIADDVSLYDLAEVKKLVKAARKALDKHTREPHRIPEHDLRRLMRAYYWGNAYVTAYRKERAWLDRRR